MSKPWSQNGILKRRLIYILLALSVIYLTISIVYALIYRPDNGFVQIHGVDLTWDKRDIPIICFYEPLMPIADMIDIEKAIDHINDRTRHKMLFMPASWDMDTPPKPTEGAVYLTTSQGQPSLAHHPGGHTVLTIKKGHIVSATIYMNSKLEDTYRRRAWLHEFGHLMGLAHDKNISSVMSPLLNRVGYLTEKDINRLKEAYK